MQSYVALLIVAPFFIKLIISISLEVEIDPD